MRWMSPELFYPDKTCVKSARLTKQSDCYAFGMVIYEVLSGQVPFAPFHYCIVLRKVIQGDRPSRPNGPEGKRFSNDLWRTLNRCWAARPERRPSVTTVLECLERVSRVPETPFRQSDESVVMDGDDQDIASHSFRTTSRFKPRQFTAFLRGILCFPQLRAISRKILQGKRT